MAGGNSHRPLAAPPGGGAAPGTAALRTRTAYYVAVSTVLARGVTRPTWSDVIRMVRPKGSRTTFYDIAGAHAKHSLIGDLLAHETVDLMHLALIYRRATAVEQLIDEAKVWSFWPYRERMARRCHSKTGCDRQEPAEVLTASLQRWARRNRALAAATEYAPPVCAVEDLLLGRPGQRSVRQAMDELRLCIQQAISGGCRD
jgi:hypothetical protein